MTPRYSLKLTIQNITLLNPEYYALNYRIILPNIFEISCNSNWKTFWREYFDPKIFKWRMSYSYETPAWKWEKKQEKNRFYNFYYMSTKQRGGKGKKIHIPSISWLVNGSWLEFMQHTWWQLCAFGNEVNTSKASPLFPRMPLRNWNTVDLYHPRQNLNGSTQNRQFYK